MTIIDAPCGKGKSSWAYQIINREQDTNFVYCALYLDELARVKKECRKTDGGCRFVEPQPFERTKIEDFNALLSEGLDIAVTHTTFLNATSDTLDYIRRGNYSLIIDEALDAVIEFNHVQSVEKNEQTTQQVSKGDIKFLKDTNIISIDADYKVTWHGGDVGCDFKYSEVERYANLGRLYCARKEMLMVVFPPEIFKYFKRVYIMTYMHSGNIFPYYLQYYHIPYTLMSVEKTGAEYNLCKYSRDGDCLFREECRKLIHICNNKRINEGYEKCALSISWFDRAADKSKDKEKGQLKRLKKNMGYYFNTYAKGAKASNGDMMWTCPKKYADALKGKGYTIIRPLTAQEKKLPEKEKKDVESELSCFISHNKRATNNFRNRWALAFCINKYYNNLVTGFFEDGNDQREKNGEKPIKLNQDDYALSVMIQWIFRSRIRDGKHIVLYIPSKRMRDLLTDWLGIERIP